MLLRNIHAPKPPAPVAFAKLRELHFDLAAEPIKIASPKLHGVVREHLWRRLKTSGNSLKILLASAALCPVSEGHNVNSVPNWRIGVIVLLFSVELNAKPAMLLS
jgi:hypothetical protein